MLKASMLHSKKGAGVKRKIQPSSSRISNVKMKLTEQPDDAVWTNELVRSLRCAHSGQGKRAPQGPSSCPSHPGAPAVVSGPGDSWEVDSGFSSEASPSASGRSSPCASPGPSAVVALDCEMVGTGPGGCCSELARCSIVDHHGAVVYDKYVQPCQPVTDYRTPWSGIQRHHLLGATPFAQARAEILAILEGKVVIGHSVYNDFEVLDVTHPGHMVRDTSSSPLLSRLAGLSRKHSLKVLTRKLLNRRIQCGRRGHDSVEDAQAALDLYKLVEDEWERAVQTTLGYGAAPEEPSSSSHYMQDQYWPSEVVFHGQ